MSRKINTRLPAPSKGKTDILALSHQRLTEWLREHELEDYRATQIQKWIYQRRVDSFTHMSDLSKDLRHQLESHFFIGRLAVVRIASASDGVHKYLFRLADGRHIESVLIPAQGHSTVCISSQVGCAQGCKFCLTSQGGLQRNLTAGEIVAQVREIGILQAPEPQPSHIVFMGMGEPLANFDPVVTAIETLTAKTWGLGLSSRHLTLSTAGLVPRLADLGRLSDVNLAISLNASDNVTRSRIMPINRKYPLEMLLQASRNYPLRPRRRITFEYILIAGVNDSPADAIRLTRLLRSLKAKINLIPFNPHPGTEFRRPDENNILEFQRILHRHNFTAIIRQSKGGDIAAACGQLRAAHPNGI
jgi:23S rRNA (adenine2503-C2)-methyltransferase